MRLKEAKEYVAGKLGCGVRELSDPVAMEEIRIDRGFGTMPFTSSTRPDDAGMMEAKFNISRALDIPINCVERFARRAGLRD